MRADMVQTQRIYDAERMMWRTYRAWYHAQVLAHYPDTGGNSLFVHNWYVCNRKDEQADQFLRDLDARWEPIKARMRRWQDQAQHREHVKADEVGRYLWCAACKAAVS